MSSSKQTRANRRNSRKSTGPFTPQGKAASAQNARQHGLAGGFTILAHEDRAEFQDLLQEYNAEFAPKSAHEKFLVQEMAQARWTLARARRIEAHLLDQLTGLEPAGDPDARIAAALKARSGSALPRFSATQPPRIAPISAHIASWRRAVIPNCETKPMRRKPGSGTG